MKKWNIIAVLLLALLLLAACTDPRSSEQETATAGLPTLSPNQTGSDPSSPAPSEVASGNAEPATAEPANGETVNGGPANSETPGVESGSAGNDSQPVDQTDGLAETTTEPEGVLDVVDEVTVTADGGIVDMLDDD